MKEQLTALDLYYLLQEFQVLKGAKLQKIYQPTNKSLFLEFHVINKGKINLYIDDKSTYLSEKKPSMSEPKSFCKLLRKHLTNSILKEITQHDSQRIMILEFMVLREKEKEKMKLICEFFDKGNIIFCDSRDTIISPIQVQHFKTRNIAAKEKYHFPESKNVFYINEKQFKDELKSSSDTLGKTLARDFNLGKIYSDEVVFNSHVQKDIICSTLTEKDIDNIHKAYSQLLNKKKNPCIYADEIVPFQLNHLNIEPKTGFSSFSQAIESVLFNKKIETNNKNNAEIEKIKSAIKIQQEQVIKLQEDAEYNQKAGELIYQNYKLIEEILNTLRRAREKYSWQEIKEKIKNHKIIKNINEKTGEIEIELYSD